MTESLIEKLEARAKLASEEGNRHNDEFQHGLAAGLREGIHEIRQLQAWQPVETIPEGVDVLCLVHRNYDTGNEKHDMLVGRYLWDMKDGKPDERIIDWGGENLNWEYEGTVFKVTHWMPLPEPPSK